VNRNVFRAVLMDGQLRLEHGNWFHARRPATTNARLLNFVLVRWTTRSLWADDRVQPSRPKLACCSDKYAKASPCTDLYIIIIMSYGGAIHVSTLLPSMKAAVLELC